MERIKNGSYEDPRKTVEDVKKAFPYFRIEPGRDDYVRQGNEFAHPYAEECMSQDSVDVMAKQVNLFTSMEELKKIRDAYTEANKQNWERINSEHPEYEEFGFWEDYYVDGCPEEPDAPKVHVLVRRIRESYKKGPYPVVIPVAVGGLFLHDPYMFCNAPITKYFGCVLVVPEVRTYPDAEYPAAINDLHATYQWMVQNAEKLDIDIDRVVIEGASSGGHLVAALPFRLKRYHWCGGTMPRGVVTFDAFFDDRETTRSMRVLNKGWSGIVNRAANMRYMGKTLHPDLSVRRHTQTTPRLKSAREFLPTRCI